MLKHLDIKYKHRQDILDSLTMVVDTREKKNKHITDYFDTKGIPYIKQKLQFGDYSCMIPANPKLGIPCDISFRNQISIERKANANELAMNLTKRRENLKYELLESTGMLLLVENSTYEDICRGDYGAGKYNSKYNPKSFISSLHSLSTEFDVPFIFLREKEFSGYFIYAHFYYYVRNQFK